MGNLRLSIVVLGSCAALVLAGCGSGGGNGGGGGNPTAIINGTVSGTTVVAVDADGQILASDDTLGKVPDSNGQFSFSLTGIPVNEDVRVFLISHGAIFPMFFDSDGNGSNDTNVFSVNAQATINLGFVDVSLSSEAGRAIPTNDPMANAAFVAQTPAIHEIPAGLNRPVLSGATADESVANGLSALASGWVIGARAWFFNVVDQAGSSSSTVSDTARFLYALTRVAAVGFDTLPDGNPADLNRVGDLLDRLGVANDETRGNWHQISLPAPLPSDSPTGNDYRNFLYTTVGAELAGAIENLNAITPSFTTTLVNPLDQSQVEIDYGDVLVLRSIYESALAAIATLRAYDLDGDVDAAVNNAITAQSFVANNANFLTLTDPTKLAEAKGYLQSGAIDDLKTAINSINAETDDQSNDLVTLDALQDPVAAQALLDQIAASLTNGATAVGSSTLNLAHFFDDGIDFRSPNRLPPLAGNHVSGLLPDATFDGVVVSPDLNEDVNPADGVPDVLQ